MITTRVIGVAEYQISSEEAGVINARYVSSGSVRSSGGIGSGRARGDTSNGFPGDYRVQYFDAAGELTGDLDLRIQRAGASLLLAVAVALVVTACGGTSHPRLWGAFTERGLANVPRKSAGGAAKTLRPGITTRNR
ncbi:hypothetical protein [Mycobacterium gastri]|nr:hypothetical protein [Mycobacterium gastri]